MPVLHITASSGHRSCLLAPYLLARGQIDLAKQVAGFLAVSDRLFQSALMLKGISDAGFPLIEPLAIAAVMLPCVLGLVKKVALHHSKDGAQPSFVRTLGYGVDAETDHLSRGLLIERRPHHQN
jgi:hypothetical protein